MRNVWLWLRSLEHRELATRSRDDFGPTFPFPLHQWWSEGAYPLIQLFLSTYLELKDNTLTSSFNADTV